MAYTTAPQTAKDPETIRVEEERLPPPDDEILSETEWVIWISEDNPNSCEDCASRNGMIFKKDELTVTPPLHPNCKCKIKPLMSLPDGELVTEDGTPVTTKAPQMGEETYTIPNGGVYADTGKRKSSKWKFSIGDIFIDVKNAKEKAEQAAVQAAAKVEVEAVIAATNAFINLHFSVDEHYIYNKNLKFDGTKHIVDQEKGNAGKIKMGVALLDSNACGWVAAYNSFVSLGMNVHPANIVKFIETKNGLIADGALGTNPLVFDRLFEKYGVKSTTMLFEDVIHILPDKDVTHILSVEDVIRGLPVIKALETGLRLLPRASQVNLDSLAQKGQTIILTYYNDKDDIGEGAHYISVEWNEKEKKYTTWNTGENEDKEKFESISEYLKRGNSGLISMTVISNHETYKEWGEYNPVEIPNGGVYVGYYED